MRNAIPDLYIQAHGDYVQTLEENIALTNAREMTVKQAMHLTASKWDRINEQEGRENQLKHWLFLKSQYPQQGVPFIGE